MLKHQCAWHITVSLKIFRLLRDVFRQQLLKTFILSLTLTKSSTPVTTTSTMTPQEFNAWKQTTAPIRAVVPEQIQDFESQEQSLEELKQQTLKRRK